MKPFGEDAVLHHIGVAVKSLPVGHGQFDPVQSVWVDFLDVHGVKLELITSNDERSPIYNAIRNNQKLVHLCFKVPRLDLAIRLSREYGFREITTPVEACALGGRIVWLYHPVLGLFELLETIC